MTQQNSLWNIIVSPALWKRALQGAGLAIVLLATFLTIVGAIDDGTWVMVPMLTIAIAGGCGGIFYHLANFLRIQNGWNKTVVVAICVIVYCIGLWLGLVYGLSLVGLWD